jgi:hypothetical protein
MHIVWATSCATAGGSGQLLMPIIGATSTAACTLCGRSASMRSSRCPPIEWPIATCGPGASDDQAFSNPAPSSTSASKLSKWPPLIVPRDSPWLRQSKEATFHPRACQCAIGSRYFSMKSPRPLAKRMLPFAFVPTGCGQSKRLSFQPSPAAQVENAAPAGIERRFGERSFMSAGYGLASNQV